MRVRELQNPRLRLPLKFIESLRPSLRTVALLANAGLGRAEIATLLGISDVALRQRISGLRRAWKQSGAAADVDGFEVPPRHPLPRGRRRGSVKTTLVKLPKGRLAVAPGRALGLPQRHSQIARPRQLREQP